MCRSHSNRRMLGGLCRFRYLLFLWYRHRRMIPNWVLRLDFPRMSHVAFSKDLCEYSMGELRNNFGICSLEALVSMLLCPWIDGQSSQIAIAVNLKVSAEIYIGCFFSQHHFLYRWSSCSLLHTRNCQIRVSLRFERELNQLEGHVREPKTKEASQKKRIDRP